MAMAKKNRDLGFFAYGTDYHSQCSNAAMSSNMLLLIPDLLESLQASTSLQSPPSSNHNVYTILQLRSQERTTQHPVRVFRFHVLYLAWVSSDKWNKHFLLRTCIVFEPKRSRPNSRVAISSILSSTFTWRTCY